MPMFFLYPLASVLLIASLQRKEIRMKYWILFAVFAVAVVVFHFIAVKQEIQYFIIIFLHFAVLLRILHLFVLDIAESKWVNFFFVGLALYELTVILKFVNILTKLINANEYFIVTTIFEIALGLFFVLFRADNRRIVFQLK